MDAVLRQLYILLGKIDYLAILTFIFIAVVAVVLGLARLLAKKGAPQQRLEKLVAGNPQVAAEEKPAAANLIGEAAGQSLYARLFRPLQETFAPKRGEVRKHLRLKLLQAGYRTEGALYNFIAAKVLLCLALPIGYALFRFFYKFTPDVLAMALLLAFIGFFLPDLIVRVLISKRQERVTRALPDALDLMVVCVEAGYGLDMTFKRVGEEMRPLCSELSDEFFLTNMEVRAGRPRDESLKDMATRTGVAEISNLVTMLIQTGRFGTSLAKALRVHADAMRIKRRQIAEEMAAKSSVKLVFPLILFIFPALMIVLAGPAFIRIFQSFLPILAR